MSETRGHVVREVAQLPQAGQISLSGSLKQKWGWRGEMSGSREEHYKLSKNLIGLRDRKNSFRGRSRVSNEDGERDEVGEGQWNLGNHRGWPSL